MTSANTITVRLVRSFEYKTVRTLYFHDVDLENTTLDQLKSQVDERLQSTENLKFLKDIAFDTFKIYSQPHGAKTSNPVINLNDDEQLIFTDWSKSLSSLSFRTNCSDLTKWLQFLENETEVSLFVRAEYEKYKENPVFKW